jgi:hypothetical protein
MNKLFFIRAEWDEEAAVWVATSDDVPGLATEAATMDTRSQAKLRTKFLRANYPSHGQPQSPDGQQFYAGAVAIGQAACLLSGASRSGRSSIWDYPITKLHFAAGLDHLVEHCGWGRREVRVEIDALPIGRCPMQAAGL